MTSQLALMNQMAVALASDSAVTVGEKTYNSVQKIFTLDGNQQIGFMIAGTATYIPCDVHWERVIKLFSDDIGSASFATLSDCVEKFKSFVTNEANLAPNSENDIMIQADLIEFMEDLLKTKHKEQLDEVVRNVSGDLYEEYPGLDERISKSITDRIDYYHDLLKGYSDDLDEDSKHKHFRILKRNKDTINGAAEYFGKKHEISSKDTKKTQFIMAYHLAEHSSLTSRTGRWRESTNLVIAGFGTEQLTPELYELRVGSIVDEENGPFYDGDVHTIRAREDLSDYGETIQEGKDWSAGAFIIPYAQSSEIQTILNGIHGDFIDDYLLGPHPNFIGNAILNLLDNAILNLDGIGPATYSKIEDCFKECATEIKSKIISENKDAINHYRMKRRGLFRRSTKSMAAQQLAEFAKKLVAMEAEITYYSKSKRTVGGDILTATITKEHGFVFQR